MCPRNILDTQYIVLTLGIGLLCRIPDPEAVKPEEWDEDAPLEIIDEDEVKPEGWLEDEADEVDDSGGLPSPPLSTPSHPARVA